MDAGDNHLGVEATEPAAGRLGRPKDSAKRDEIIAAATALFMDQGYAETSMEAVARLAGVSKLTIYSHFADKAQLFRAIIQDRCARLGMPDAFDAERELPVREALIKIGRYAAAMIFRPDSIRLIRIIQAEAQRHPEMVEAYTEVGPRRVRTAFIDLLDHFVAQGTLYIADTTLAAEQFFSVLKGERLTRALMLYAPEPSAADLDGHVGATVTFFLAVYGRPFPLSPATDQA